MPNKKRSRVKRVALILVGLLLLLCLAGAAISIITNRNLPIEAAGAAQLSELDKVRLAEIFHLRQTLGDAVWPGWGQADIPAILYNESHAFLVDLPDPQPGWIKLPQQHRGGPWQPVPDDTFVGQIYYRQQLPDGVTPEAFTVLVGDHWVSSMATKEWLVMALANQFREELPPGIDVVFPYRLVTNLFISSSDFYVASVLHESFHAYQGIVAPEKLAAAERAVDLHESQYPWDDGAFQEAWQTELDLLAQALRAETDAETVRLARQFLVQRQQRWAGMAPGLTAYEQQREWLEGLARYVELEIWRRAAATADYRPLPAVRDDPDFEAYATFDRRWAQEIDQMGRMAKDEGDGRFYYSGMAQAALLDRLLPDWKTLAMDEGVFLGDLLQRAIQ